MLTHRQKLFFVSNLVFSLVCLVVTLQQCESHLLPALMASVSAVGVFNAALALVCSRS